MVGVNFCFRKLGTVAIFATLLAAIVNGDTGCTYHLQNISDFNSLCSDRSSDWTIDLDADYSPNKKVLIVLPQHKGCIRTKNAVAINSTSLVTLKYYQTEKNDKNKLSLRLIPSKGLCSDEECFWDITGDPQFEKSEAWITFAHKFPLKVPQEFYAEIEVNNQGKGKCFIDSLSFPNTSSKCRQDEEPLEVQDFEELKFVDSLIQIDGNATQNPEGGTTAGDGTTKAPKKNHSPSIEEFSKNLLLTSASVLTLNNLIN